MTIPGSLGLRGNESLLSSAGSSTTDPAGRKGHRATPWSPHECPANLRLFADFAVLLDRGTVVALLVDPLYALFELHYATAKISHDAR